MATAMTKKESKWTSSPLRCAETRGRQAADWGVDWEHWSGAFAKVQKELEELNKLLQQGTDSEARRITEELGDLLFSVVNLARHIDVDPEEALWRAIDKFQERIDRLQSTAASEGVDVESLDIEYLEQLWERAKQEKHT